MSKDFRTAAIAASIAIGTPSVLSAPVTHASANGANDVNSTAVEARLASSPNLDHANVEASAILLATLSAMDPQQKSELAIDRIPALNVEHVYQLAASGRCVCTGCCITSSAKGRSPSKSGTSSQPSTPQGQSPSKPGPAKAGAKQ